MSLPDEIEPPTEAELAQRLGDLMIVPDWSLRDVLAQHAPDPQPTRALAHAESVLTIIAGECRIAFGIEPEQPSEEGPAIPNWKERRGL